MTAKRAFDPNNAACTRRAIIRRDEDPTHVDRWHAVLPLTLALDCNQRPEHLAHIARIKARYRLGQFHSVPNRKNMPGLNDASHLAPRSAFHRAPVSIGGGFPDLGLEGLHLADAAVAGGPLLRGAPRKAPFE
jgi:hypothetical protein